MQAQHPAVRLPANFMQPGTHSQREARPCARHRAAQTSHRFFGRSCGAWSAAPAASPVMFRLGILHARTKGAQA
eukprot:353459-Chlamydomonas_euryale.AAC.6